MKVKFTQKHETPTHLYREGATVDLPDDKAAEVIELGVATAATVAKKKPKPKPETEE